MSCEPIYSVGTDRYRIEANAVVDITRLDESLSRRVSLPSADRLRWMVYEMKISVVDLRTGVDRELTLSVPFEGQWPIPETGVSSINRGASTESLYASGLPVLWIDRLCVDRDHLMIVLAHGSERAVLGFDLSALLADEQESSDEVRR